MIGEQEWMAENLRVTHYRDGTEILTGLSHTEWENTTEGAYTVYEHGEDEHRMKLRSSEIMAASSHMRNDPGEKVEEIDRIAGTEQAYSKLYNWYAVNHKY